MPVLRQHHTRDFTVIPNALLQDQRLSCRERGLLVWMLSKPPEWNFSHKALLAELPYDKKGVVQSCINKLTETGYLRITQERSCGRLGKTVWYVYDVPYPNIRDTAAQTPQSGKTEHGSPYPEIPEPGKPPSYKRKKIKKKDAVFALEGGTQLSENLYFNQESGEWCWKEKV